jgi:DNA-binding beta-propeller fold protein YncE
MRQITPEGRNRARQGIWGRALLASVALACGSPEPPKAPPVVVEQFPTPPPEPTTSLPFAPVPPILLRGVGFESPESVLYDPSADVYYVSNVGPGGPIDVDNNGFISKVTPDGTLLELHFIDGAKSGTPLNAPKGMALQGDTLFVTDIDTVRGFDRKSGKSLGDVVIPSALFLNDLAAGGGGVLYVSDTGIGKVKGSTELGHTLADAIYVIDAQRSVRVLAKGSALAEPNGLWVEKGRLVIAATTGEIYALDARGQKTPLGKPPSAGLDGLIETPGGRMVVTSWDGSAAYISRLPPAAPGEFEPLITDLTSPADLGYDAKRRQLLIPLFKENALYIQELPGDVN